VTAMKRSAGSEWGRSMDSIDRMLLLIAIASAAGAYPAHPLTPLSMYYSLVFIVAGFTLIWRGQRAP